MGLFKSFKKALPTIAGTVGFAIGGPAGAAIGSGIGSLASGGDVQDALVSAAMGYGIGTAAQGMGFTAAPKSATGFSKFVPGRQMVTGYDTALGKAVVESKPMFGIGSSGTAAKTLSDLTFGQKALLGGGAALGLGSLLGEQEEEKTGGFRYPDTGPGEAEGVLVGRSGTRYNVNDPEDMKRYADEMRELQDPGYDYRTDPYRPVARSSGYMQGGEVNGPGTGTSDSVPARLSDGEFVLTAKAVRGAGGGDRDIGAARLYDMMSELEATA